MMDMAADQEERDRYYAEYKAFVLDKLPPIADYVSSSEDEEPVANSSLTKSIDEPVSPQPPRNRLPGISEKWNSDAESVDQNDNGVEHHVEDIHDTNDTSDSGSEGLWGDGNFDNGHDDLDESTQYEPDIAESSFGTVQEKLPTLKRSGTSRGGGGLKVSSFVTVNPNTGIQMDNEESVFTATEETLISPIFSPQSCSATSQVGDIPANTDATVATVRVTQTQQKKQGSSKTSSSSSSLSRVSRSNSAKTVSVQNPPPSTSKIITRTRREYQHEEDIGNNEDLYALYTAKRQKK
jgi:hypothetical protein